METQYNYKELAKTYNNFLTPVVEIYVDNGKDNILKKGDITIDSLEVTLSAERVSGLNFQVINAYDPVAKKINQKVKDSFSAGKILQVALGYGSSLTTVFKGYVTEFRTSYQASPVVSVAAVDLRKLLMENIRIRYQYKEKSYSDVFEEILGNYKKLYNNIYVDEMKEKVTLLQNTSDYNFIKGQLCPKADADFYMIGGDVYFKKSVSPEKEKGLIELKWGESLISFRRASKYCNKQLKLYSYQDDKTVATATANIKTEKDISSLTQKTVIEEREEEGGLSKDDLNNCAEKEEKEKEKKNRSGGGSLIGLPEIIPGKYVQISGVDPEDAGDCYISEVTHSFGSDGFTTSFVIGDENDSLIQEKSASDLPSASQGKNGWEGVMHAVVKENWNKENPGKVLVEFLSGEEGKNDTKWLPVLSPYCGKEYGIYFHPEVGTEVVVGSLSCGTNSLVVLGGLWNKEDTLPPDTAGEKNEVKRIRTKGKHEILFRDTDKEGGIEIRTAKGLHIVMDDKTEVINLLDEKEENGLKINQKDGVVQLLAKKKICISVNGKDGILFDSTGKLALKADQIAEDATNSFQLKTQKLEMKGSMAELKADGSVKINSSGIVEVKGSLLKLN